MPGEPKNQLPFTRKLAGHPPSLPASAGAPAPAALFPGKGLFTAWDPASAFNKGADWVALQADPEGGASNHLLDIAQMFPRPFIWQARATQEGADLAKDLCGYIGQAESEPEALACLAVKPHGRKAVVGNPSGWSPETFQRLLAEGWELVLEWYWNAQPTLTAPDSSHYPVSTVLFGCYDASSEQANGRRVSLADYRKVYSGPYGVWLAETLTSEDWEVFAGV